MSLFRPVLSPRRALLGVALCAMTACAQQGTHHAQKASGNLQQVAAFDHQATGVTVTEGNRIFVNFPRWTEDAPISVAEVQKDGSLTPYPNAEWNAWRNTKKDQISVADHWVCVQSVVADGHGSLWVIDPGSPGNERVLPGAAKLVKIDLASNRVSKVIPFNETIASQSSYLNDLRLSKDGRHAYLTDSGKPALVVVDLVNGQARRVLENLPSTKAEPGVVIHADGRELRRPDGRAPVFNADGIALSADGQALYWQATTGRTLYRVPTALLDRPQRPGALEHAVEQVGTNGVADGLWIDPLNHMYVTAPEENAVKLRTDLNSGGADPVIAVQDARLRWPDTMSQGPDGTLYVTASHIQDSPWFKPGADKSVKTELFSFSPVE